MSTFEDLGLANSVLEHLRSLGYRRPSAVQEEAVPVIARGTSFAGVASSGSGKTLAYALGLAGRLDPGSPGLQALVLRPTDDAAANTAETLQKLLATSGLQTGLIAAGAFRARKSAQIMVSSPGSALTAVQNSSVKLEDLGCLVVDGAASMYELGAGDALETLSGLIPKDAQRVLLTADLSEPVEDWLERHARRARRLADIPAEAEPVKEAGAECYASPRHTWLAALAGAIESATRKGAGGCAIHCRSEREAGELADRLHVRGLHALHEGSELHVSGEESSSGGVLSVSWGGPLDLAALREIVEEPGPTLFLVEPSELSHMERLAAAIELRLTAHRAPPQREAHGSAQSTRDRLRAAALERDLEPYVLLLEPLLEDFAPMELAAAAAALLREKAPAEPATSLPAWTRLYFGVGRRDGIRPGDLVGAITGEASLSGEDIGRIDIRENYSLVEITAPLADQVIKSLSSATIRGKHAHVRLFRE